jgi:hypothetical protein
MSKSYGKAEEAAKKIINMVKFKDFCENITEKEYRASSRPSYSFLKELEDKGPSVIRDGIEFKDSPGLRLGSMVDGLTTNPEYNILDKFQITNVPFDLSGETHTSKVLKYIYNNKINDVNEDKFNNICNELKFKRPPSFNDNLFQIQLNMIKGMLNGKKYISEKEYKLAINMSDTLKTHDFTRNIFNPDPDIEVIYQAIIFFTIFGLEVKSMLDIIHVDHKNKLIYPMDIKTGSLYNFMINFYEFKYYLQAAKYTIAVYYIKENNKEFKDYKVMPFKFIYISREKPNLPLIYEMKEDFIELASKGWTSIGGKRYKGILEIVKDYQWYIKNDEYDLKRDIVENNGVISINTPIV